MKTNSRKARLVCALGLCAAMGIAYPLHATFAEEASAPAAEATQKDPLIPETIDIQGTSYSPTFTTLPKGSMEEFAGKQLKAYSSFVHYIDIFTGQKLKFSEYSATYPNFYNKETGTRLFTSTKPSDMQGFVQYRIPGYIFLNEPKLAAEETHETPIDTYIYCVPMKSYTINYCDEEHMDKPLLQANLSTRFAFQAINPYPHIPLHVTQWKFVPLDIPGYTLVSDSEGVSGDYSIAQKSPEDTAPIVKNIVYKKNPSSVRAQFIWKNVEMYGTPKFSVKQPGFDIDLTWGEDYNIHETSQGRIDQYLAQGRTLAGYFNGPNYSVGFDTPNVITVYAVQNAPVYVHYYACAYDSSNNLQVLDTLKTDVLGTRNPDTKVIPNGEWSYDLSDKQTLTIPQEDGTTKTYKLVAHEGDTSGKFGPFKNVLNLMYVEQKDAESQTDPTTTAEGTTQTDNPSTNEDTTQTDNPTTAEGTTQTDNPVSTDNGTQTDEKQTSEGTTQTDNPSTSEGTTQTDTPGTSDAGTQVTPDSTEAGTQTKPETSEGSSQTDSVDNPASDPVETPVKPTLKPNPAHKDATVRKLPATNDNLISVVGITIAAAVVGIAAFVVRKFQSR